MTEIGLILEKCCREVPSAYSAVLIDAASGTTIDAVTRDEKFNLAPMAGALSEAAKRHHSALEAVGTSHAPSENLILTTNKGSLLLHLFGSSKERTYIIAMAAGRLANPGMARLVLAAYEARLLELLQS
jgi:hypothetical protein